MRLKSLEMSGFKSFTERTTLQFTPEISAIVGPNGCGKSNIVDALRWVMGEQSARHLRGHQMEDVIFNGSESLPPTGMAEVSLVFENEDGRGPVEYNGFSEIVVTRRLFRSGESEYAINRVACRLRDIVDLFLGTGVGNRAYSIVEQGRVEELVNARPDERRGIIEEAAGTSKYRNRKLAAERKLQQTHQNLLRVIDIVREIERQIRSLELQAKKAERYRSFKEELKEREVFWAALRRRGIEEEIASAEARLQAVEDDLVRLLASIHSKEAELEEGRRALLEADRGISAGQETLYQLKVEIRGEEQKIGFYKKDQADLDVARGKAQAETVEMQTKLQGFSLEIEGFKKAGEDFLQLCLFEETLLREREAGLEGIRHQIRGLQSELDQGKEALAQISNRVSHLKNEQSARERRLEDATGELSKKQIEQAEAQASLQARKDERREKQRELEDSLARAQGTEREIGESRERLKEWSRARDVDERQLETLKEQLQEIRSRLVSLEAIQKNYEGYQEGVRAVMFKRQEDAVFEGVHGLVADVIEAPVVFEKALTAVLGDRLQYMIVQGHKAGVEAIEFLKRESAGRGTFIPRELSRNGRRSHRPAMPETVSPLLEMVSVKEGYGEIAEYLLGDVAVVQDLNSGLELWNRNGFSNTLVTLEGEVIDPMGAVTGGSVDGLEGNPLSQRRSLKELRASLGEMEEQVRAKEKEVGDLKGRIEKAEARNSVLVEEGHRLEVERIQLEHGVSRTDQEVTRLEEILGLSAQEHVDLTKLQRSLVESIRENQTDIDALLRERSDKEKALADVREEMSRLSGELENVESQVTESRIRAAALGERKENARINLENHMRLREELSGLIRSREAQIEEIDGKRVSIQEDLLVAERSLEENQQRRDEIERALDVERLKYRDLSRSLTEMEEAIKDLRPLEAASQEEKTRLQLFLSERRMSLQHLKENIWEKYAVDLMGVPLDGMGGDAAPETLSEEVEELRRRLERLGEVNLGAISEYEELSARYDFLSQQKQDLEKSMTDLHRTIAKLNRFCRVRFKESFEEINQKFQETFVNLFGGGKARLVLTDENDYLETGVEIVAQPPGKKLQLITLLSGGEKALTAVSLLFAIFLTKPSPFCFLDEVDAPLDDANVDRFLEVVRTMCRFSQFVLITHNKRTMQAADVLYGITMADPGISKVVSVRMN